MVLQAKEQEWSPSETQRAGGLGRGVAPPAAHSMRLAYLMLAFMVPLVVLSQLLRSANGVIAPNLMRDLSLSAEDIGGLTSSFFMIFAIMQIPVGVLIDRYGAHKVIAIMMIFPIAGSLLFASSGSLGGLTVGRVMMGFGLAGTMVGSMVICSRWFAAGRFAMATAILFTSANIGNLLATGPLAAVASVWNWRGAFVGLAFVAAGLTLLFFIFVRDAPRNHPFHDNAPASLADTLKGLRQVWSYRDVVYILPMVAVGYASVISILGLWGGPYLYEVYGLDQVARGTVLSLMALAMIAGTLCYGPLDRWFNTRRGVVTGGALITTAVLLVLAAFPAPALWQAATLLCLFSFFGAYSLVVMTHGVSLFPDQLVGRGVTTLNMGLMGGAALLQVATGQLIGAFPDRQGDAGDLAYRLLFAFLAVVTILSLTVYRRARDVRPDQVGESSPGKARDVRPDMATGSDRDAA